MIHRPRSRLRAIFGSEPLIKWLIGLQWAGTLTFILWGFWTMAP